MFSNQGNHVRPSHCEQVVCIFPLMPLLRSLLLHYGSIIWTSYKHGAKSRVLVTILFVWDAETLSCFLKFFSFLEDGEGWGGICSRRGWRRKEMEGFHHFSVEVRCHGDAHHLVCKEALGPCRVVGGPQVLTCHGLVIGSWESCLISLSCWFIICIKGDHNICCVCLKIIMKIK